MNVIRKAANQASVDVACTTRLIKSLSTLGLAALAFSATLASAVDVVLLASASTTAASTHASPEQVLATIHVQGGYDASTRSELLAVSRYPNNPDARNQQLQGKVAVAFEIDRQGVLQGANVSQSSRSKILDAAALASVRWAKYQPFPSDLLPGENGRRYTVMFDYRFDAQK